MDEYAESLESSVLKTIQSSVAGTLESLQVSQDLDMSQSTWGDDEAFYNMWNIIESKTGKSCINDFNQKVAFNYSDYYYNDTLAYTYGNDAQGTSWKYQNETVLNHYANKSSVYFENYFSATEMFCVYYSYYYGNFSKIDRIVNLCTSEMDVECSYFQTVLNHPLEFFDIDSEVSIKTVGELYTDTGGIKHANVEIDFEQYYNLCKPSQCQYTETRGNTAVEIMVTLLSLYGGLTLVLNKLIDNTIGWYYKPSPIKAVTSRFIHSPRA